MIMELGVTQPDVVRSSVGRVKVIGEMIDKLIIEKEMLHTHIHNVQANEIIDPANSDEERSTSFDSLHVEAYSEQGDAQEGERESSQGKKEDFGSGRDNAEVIWEQRVDAAVTTTSVSVSSRSTTSPIEVGDEDCGAGGGRSERMEILREGGETEVKAEKSSPTIGVSPSPSPEPSFPSSAAPASLSSTDRNEQEQKPFVGSPHDAEGGGGGEVNANNVGDANTELRLVEGGDHKEVMGSATGKWGGGVEDSDIGGVRDRSGAIACSGREDEVMVGCDDEAKRPGRQTSSSPLKRRWSDLIGDESENVGGDREGDGLLKAKQTCEGEVVERERTEGEMVDSAINKIINESGGWGEGGDMFNAIAAKTVSRDETSSAQSPARIGREAVDDDEDDDENLLTAVKRKSGSPQAPSELSHTRTHSGTGTRSSRAPGGTVSVEASSSSTAKGVGDGSRSHKKKVPVHHRGRFQKGGGRLGVSRPDDREIKGKAELGQGSGRSSPSPSKVGETTSACEGGRRRKGRGGRRGSGQSTGIDGVGVGEEGEVEMGGVRKNPPRRLRSGFGSQPYLSDKCEDKNEYENEDEKNGGMGRAVEANGQVSGGRRNSKIKLRRRWRESEVALIERAEAVDRELTVLQDEKARLLALLYESLNTAVGVVDAVSRTVANNLHHLPTVENRLTQITHKKSEPPKAQQRRPPVTSRQLMDDKKDPGEKDKEIKSKTITANDEAEGPEMNEVSERHEGSEDQGDGERSDRAVEQVSFPSSPALPVASTGFCHSPKTSPINTSTEGVPTTTSSNDPSTHAPQTTTSRKSPSSHISHGHHPYLGLISSQGSVVGRPVHIPRQARQNESSSLKKGTGDGNGRDGSGLEVDMHVEQRAGGERTNQKTIEQIEEDAIRVMGLDMDETPVAGSTRVDLTSDPSAVCGETNRRDDACTLLEQRVFPHIGSEVNLSGFTGEGSREKSEGDGGEEADASSGREESEGTEKASMTAVSSSVTPSDGLGEPREEKEVETVRGGGAGKSLGGKRMVGRCPHGDGEVDEGEEGEGECDDEEEEEVEEGSNTKTVNANGCQQFDVNWDRVGGEDQEISVEGDGGDEGVWSESDEVMEEGEDGIFSGGVVQTDEEDEEEEEEEEDDSTREDEVGVGESGMSGTQRNVED
eukprot:GHVN01089992.1.p1 GENE.GHVN01089992.1~~GHVN01089992.1.p1  ORF type:complete len:1155 (-),score=373.11 GHVN01089992.1:169-3633(-)